MWTADMIISDNGHAASNYEIDFTNLTHEDPSWKGCDDWGRIRYILHAAAYTPRQDRGWGSVLDTLAGWSIILY